MKLNYRMPNVFDEEILKDYVSEHLSNGENSVSAGFGIQKSDYASWLKNIVEMKKGVPDFGKSKLFLCFDDERLVGLLSVRPEMNNELKRKYGNIGYGVRPTERNKGYATKMLEYGIEECRKLGLKEIEIGCYKDNKASESVILKNGGIFDRENDDYMPGRLSRYYRIEIK